MDELKPCPFCGKAPTPDFSVIDGEAAYHFHCQNAECPAWPNVSGETEADAITAWNTRSPVTDEMVERAARALALEDRIEICSDATYRLSSYGPRARAALAAALGGPHG